MQHEQPAASSSQSHDWRRKHLETTEEQTASLQHDANPATHIA